MKRSFLLVDVNPSGTLPSSADRTALLDEASSRIIALILSRCTFELPRAFVEAKKEASTGMWVIETHDAEIAAFIERGVKIGGITARFTEDFETKAVARA